MWYGTVKTIPLFCGYKTIKNSRFRSCKIALFYGYGNVNSRFINSFTRWRDISQPLYNYYYNPYHYYN